MPQLTFRPVRSPVRVGSGDRMKHREFITLFSGAAVAVPLAARAQQKTMPVIGYLSLGFTEARVAFVNAFRQGLSENGYVEGQNVALEYRWAGLEPGRFPAHAAELVALKVDVIVTAGGTL